MTNDQRFCMIMCTLIFNFVNCLLQPGFYSYGHMFVATNYAQNHAWHIVHLPIHRAPCRAGWSCTLPSEAGWFHTHPSGARWSHTPLLELDGPTYPLDGSTCPPSGSGLSHRQGPEYAIPQFLGSQTFSHNRACKIQRTEH